jgi:uncharacterized integral membrane protein
MKTKVILLLIFLVLFAIIIIQNNQQVLLRAYFWSFTMPVVILVPVVFVLGFLFGLAVCLSARKKKSKKPEPAESPAPDKP